MCLSPCCKLQFSCWSAGTQYARHKSILLRLQSCFLLTPRSRLSTFTSQVCRCSFRWRLPSSQSFGATSFERHGSHHAIVPPIARVSILLALVHLFLAMPMQLHKPLSHFHLRVGCYTLSARQQLCSFSHSHEILRSSPSANFRLPVQSRTESLPTHTVVFCPS